MKKSKNMAVWLRKIGFWLSIIAPLVVAVQRHNNDMNLQKRV
jgi:hypothetical protein